MRVTAPEAGTEFRVGRLNVVVQLSFPVAHVDFTQASLGGQGSAQLGEKGLGGGVGAAQVAGVNGGLPDALYPQVPCAFRCPVPSDAGGQLPRLPLPHVVQRGVQVPLHAPPGIVRRLPVPYQDDLTRMIRALRPAGMEL